jgi:hypothetical protein
MFTSSISETTETIRIKFCIGDSKLTNFVTIMIVAIRVLEIATGYGVDTKGVEVRLPVEARIFSSLPCPDLFWVPPTLLFYGYRRLFLWG